MSMLSAALTDGSFDLEVMTIAEVNEVRQRSKAGQGQRLGRSADHAATGKWPKRRSSTASANASTCARMPVMPWTGSKPNTISDAPAKSASRPDRPTAGADGLSMYDSIYSEPEGPQGPRARAAAGRAEFGGRRRLRRMACPNSRKAERATMKSDLIDQKVRLVQ